MAARSPALLVLSLGLLCVGAWGWQRSLFSPSLAETVVASGALRADAPLGDPGILRPGDYIEIWRKVEVFRSDWVDDAADDPAPVQDHPLGSLHSDLISALLAWVGPYRFSPPKAQILAYTALYLVPELLDREDRRLRVAGGRLYCGAGTPERPLPGDVRVSYFVVHAGQQVMLLGGLARGRQLYRVLPGTPEQAVLQLRQFQRSQVPHSQRPWAL